MEQEMQRQNLYQVVARECAGLPKEDQMKLADSILAPHHTDLFIEEPESHIFPSTQRSLVYSLVRMLNEGRKHSCFIATHSPYVMTSFNNLVLAGEKAGESEEKAALVSRLMPKSQTLHYDEVAAFEMKDGRMRSILDDEFRLISAEAIDSASQEIGDDFDYLLNL